MRVRLMTLVAPMLLAPLLLVALVGCADQPESQHDRAEAACRTQVSRTDNSVNRLDLANRDTSTTPLSANGVPGINTAPIIEREAHDKLMMDCMTGSDNLPN